MSEDGLVKRHGAAALARVYQHHRATRHGRRFFTRNDRVEIICARCGLVLYEGPGFTDPTPGWKLWIAPRKRS